MDFDEFTKLLPTVSVLQWTKAVEKWENDNMEVNLFVSMVGLSKYNYITILVIMYCNCIVSNDLAVICIGIIFTVYHM